MRADKAECFTLHRSVKPETMGRYELAATCEECGRTEKINAGRALPVDGAAQLFRNKKWTIDPKGRRAVCPDCGMTEKTYEPTQSTKKALALATRLLVENFDANKGTYDGDWSDAVIAKKVGLSEKAVADWREEGFGPLAASPEIARIDAELAKLADKVNADLNEIRELTASVARDLKQQIGALQIRLDEEMKGKRLPGKSNGMAH